MPHPLQLPGMLGPEGAFNLGPPPALLLQLLLGLLREGVAEVVGFPLKGQVHGDGEEGGVVGVGGCILWASKPLDCLGADAEGADQAGLRLGGCASQNRRR